MCIGLCCSAALAVCGLSIEAQASVAIANCRAEHWVGAWTAPPQATTLLSPSGLPIPEIEANQLPEQKFPLDFAQAQVFSYKSLRLIVAPHLGGQSLRLHLGNRFQKGNLTLDGVYIGLTQSGASLVPGSNHAVTFGGEPQVSIAPGTEIVSDPVAITTQPFQNLSISFHIQGLLNPVDYHLTAQQVSYLSAQSGAYGANEGTSQFTTAISSWYILNSIDVFAPGPTGAVVAFGDSLTDGYLSSFNQNRRWPDDLARRVLADKPQPRLSVVDAGISGNLVASNDYIFGPSGVSRFARDALSQAGVTNIILFEGINDIDHAPNNASTADKIIAADREIVAQAHAAGLKIIGATLTPAEGNQGDKVGNPGEPQALRHTVNDWIRSSGAFDAVVDFDAVGDPSNPDHIAPQYDGGDHLHFNDAGYQALADAVDLGAFQGTGCQ